MAVILYFFILSLKFYIFFSCQPLFNDPGCQPILCICVLCSVVLSTVVLCCIMVHCMYLLVLSCICNVLSLSKFPTFIFKIEISETQHITEQFGILVSQMLGVYNRIVWYIGILDVRSIKRVTHTNKKLLLNKIKSQQILGTRCSWLLDIAAQCLFAFLVGVVYLAGVYDHVYANINNCVISLTTPRARSLVLILSTTVFDNHSIVIYPGIP